MFHIEIVMQSGDFTGMELYAYDSGKIPTETNTRLNTIEACVSCGIYDVKNPNGAEWELKINGSYKDTYTSEETISSTSCAPTPAPTDSCTNESEWSNGDLTCEDLKENKEFCDYFAHVTHKRKGPKEACCACGGGDHKEIPSELPSSYPSLSPSIKPTLSVEPSMVPTSKPSNCVSDEDWFGITDLGDKVNCTSVKDKSICDAVKYHTRSPFKEVTDACCACGGGNHICIDQMDWTTGPGDNITCAHIANSTYPYKMCEFFNSTFGTKNERSGFDACCACGGSTYISVYPSQIPSVNPSQFPSSWPSNIPSPVPSGKPSLTPSEMPSSQPSSDPSSLPSSNPTSIPSSIPSTDPTSVPSVQPSRQPSVFPSMRPSRKPSSLPSEEPSHLTESPTHACVDDPNWSDGILNCTHIDDVFWCDISDAIVYGKSMKDACCACGGGNAVKMPLAEINPASKVSLHSGITEISNDANVVKISNVLKVVTFSLFAVQMLVV